jgi:hypothetical protein
MASPPEQNLTRSRQGSSRQVVKRKRERPPPQARPVVIFGRSREAVPLVRREIEALHQRYQRGDGEALLLALDLWLECYRGPPQWIANGFFDGMSRWLSYEAPTLDAALGVHRKRAGKHVEQLREREALRPRIVLRIAQLAQQGQPIDGNLFSTVAVEVGRSTAYVSKLYYEKASAGWRKLLPKIKIS